MASLASLATLGSTRQNSSLCFDTSPLLIQRISAANVGSFSNSLGGWKWGFMSVCKCVATTDLIAELESPVSAESTLKGSKDVDADLVLKPAPKPVLKARPKVELDLSVNPGSSFPQAPGKLVRDSLDEKETAEYKDKVIESLGEVLEKAEKLEVENLSRTVVKRASSADGKPAAVTSSDHPTSVTSSNPRVGRSMNSALTKKTNPSKSVWRKGNPVATVQRVVKVEKENSKMEVVEKEEPQPLAPLKPQAPPKLQPMLQAKPAVVVPPVKKPMILKDVGASSKASVSDSADAGLKTKERKPILRDKFAAKKPVVDPMLVKAVIPPPKRVKSPAISKVKDEHWKKSGAAGGMRRRLLDKSKILDEASDIGVPISGAKEVRKGRKWNKASRKAARLEAAKAAAPVKVEILEVGEEGMLMEDLAYSLAVSEADIFGYLFSKGIKPDTVQTLDKDMVKMVCKEYDVEVIEADPVRVEDMARKKEVLDEEDLEMLEERPPVLTIMGHVDHGKTTLLDCIRKSKVAASEAGGITQGIGAYKVLVPVDGKLQPCVFLDTPGHEAFGAMRARGARVTDIAVIVVAADDGVRPQTNEAIAHAKAAGVPIVIAINKIDKDGANPDKVMQELSSFGLMPEDWGGDVPMVQVSALKGENVDDLLETVMLIAEMQELKANPHRNARGTVIEAGLHKSKGPVATFIVQNGTLRRGNVVVCGEAFGKVRALFDDRGGQVVEARPSTAVQVIGLNNVPIAGDEFEVVDSLDTAREKAEARAVSLRVERISAKASDGKVTLSSIASAVSGGKLSGLDMHQLNLILKVDVQGSIEAIRHALHILPQDSVSLKFLLQAPGDVSNSDVDLAVASKAIIFGFNVKVPGSVKSYADHKGVEIRIYRVIYELIDDMRNAMEGLLEPVEEQIPIGAADVRAIFSSGSGRVAGCMVTEGNVVKGCGVRITRNRKTVYVGTLDSLKRVKEMVKEVNAGLECGIGVDDFMDWEVGDVIEAFNPVKKQRTLEEASASVVAALAGAGVQM